MRAPPAICYDALMVDLASLATLRQRLLDATDFGHAYGYFLDHFGEKPEFIEIGEPMRDAGPFKQILGHLAAKVLGKPCSVELLVLVRIREHRFIHGAFDLGSHMASVFYFEDIESGLAAFGSADASGPNHFARFSLVLAPTGGGRSTVH